MKEFATSNILEINKNIYILANINEGKNIINYVIYEKKIIIIK